MEMIKVLDITGKEIDQKKIDKNWINTPVNNKLLRECILMYQANKRQGSASTKERGQVKASGIKPWRQKGTGRARVGSSRNPVWKHGGVAFAPKPRDYSMKMNKKTRRLALKSALTCKANDGEIIVLENLDLDSLKTKNMLAILKSLGVEGKALVVTDGVNEKAVRATGNIKGVDTVLASSLNTYDILSHDKFVTTKDAISRIEEVYA